MRATAAQELFRQITRTYFADARVIFSNQSRAAKPQLGLVVITPGQVRRPYLPNYTMVDSTAVGCYQSRMTVTVDLFTHGSPVTVGGKTVYENTAVEDMLAFMDYLDSAFVTDWCRVNDLTLLLDADVQNVTGAINDNTYEYRSRMTVLLYFTQKAIGRSAVMDEESIKYPVYLTDPDTGEIVRDEYGNPVIETDPETGEPVYTTKPPEETESTSNGWQTNAQITEKGAIIDPVFRKTSTGGGTEELASKNDGYFTSVEIKEEYHE